MIENSADWVATITRRLQECRVFVAMVSPTYGAPGREVLGTCEEFNAALRRRNAYGDEMMAFTRDLADASLFRVHRAFTDKKWD